MLHTYNAILLNKKMEILICSKGDGSGFKSTKLAPEQSFALQVGAVKDQFAKAGVKVGDAIQITFEEVPFMRFMSVRLIKERESAVNLVNIRVVSSKTAMPQVGDVPENTQGLTLVRIAVAASAESNSTIDRIPFDMTSDNAMAIVKAFNSNQVHLQVLDAETSKVVHDNRQTVVVAATPVVKGPPRYNPLETDNFYIAPEGKALLSAMISGIESGQFKNANLLLVGNSGNGKTSLAYILAKVLGWNVVKVTPANVSEPEQFFGYMAMENATTSFVHTDFSKGITTPKTVVIIDEINRAHSSVLNGILNVLDDTREVGVKGGVLKVAENVIFVATMNQGSQYSGTFSADFALMNRFTWRMEVSYMPENVEIDILVRKVGVDKQEAKQIVKFATKVRNTVGDQVDMSTRTTLALATARKTGLPLRAAVEFSFVQGLEADIKKVVVDMLNSEVGWGVFDPANSIVNNIF